MKIDYLIQLAKTIHYSKEESSQLVDEENIKKAEDFLEKRYFDSKIHDAMVTAVGSLISHGERTNEDFEEYLNSLDVIHAAIIRCEYPGIKHMNSFIRVIGEASCSYNAWVVSNLALQMYYGEHTIDITGKTYKINPDDAEKLKLLSNVISQAQNKNQVHDVMDFYENCPQLINANTKNILAGENLNGTKMAMNILKSYADRDDIPYPALRLMANGEDKYIPLVQALEENVAVEGLQELQEKFSGLDLPFDQYYVKIPKEKAISHNDGKKKFKFKGNFLTSSL